jgi:membrane protein YdbS with pleckstrin-like domain
MGLMRVDEWRAAEAARQREWHRWRRAMRRWLMITWVLALALNVALVVVFVASRDPPLIALAGGLAANLIVMLFQVWLARQSEAGRGQPRR